MTYPHWLPNYSPPLWFSPEDSCDTGGDTSTPIHIGLIFIQ